ncbi:uncharacterized protein ACRADG_008047 [Cochliomyia hominivorax]
MCKNFASVLLLSVLCTATLAEPRVHTILRIRFPGPSSDKVVLPKPVKQQVASYPPAGLKPVPAFELPEPTYLPPVEPELIYGPPAETYGPPAEPELTYGPPTEPELTYGPPVEPELTYGPPAEPELTYVPPADTYGPPETNYFQSAAIVNAPLTLATQFTPPRPNKAINFRPIRPQSAAIVNAPLRPVSHFTPPRPNRIVAFRPKRPQSQNQQLYPKTQLTLPRVERLTEFRPRRIPSQQQQQSNPFSRPLTSSIFGNSNNGRSGRKLPASIFSN